MADAPKPKPKPKPPEPKHDYVVVAHVSSAVGDSVASYCVGGAEVISLGGDRTTLTTGGTLPTLTMGIM